MPAPLPKSHTRTSSNRTSSSSQTDYRELIDQERQRLSALSSTLDCLPWPFQLESRVMVERDLRIFDQLISLASSDRCGSMIAQ